MFLDMMLLPSHLVDFVIHFTDEEKNNAGTFDD
jgi:hypothetical protein